MRPSVVSLALFAGALVASYMCAASGAAACCTPPEVGKLNEPSSFDEGGAEAEEVLPSLNASPAPTPLDLSRGGLDKASYADVFGILNGDNPCSRFFGGRRAAVVVFNELVLRLRRKPLGEGALAIRMWGGYTNYHDVPTGASYRLFEVAAVNSEGPLQARAAQPGASRLKVGRFPVETRQARALILLHEMGHLIKGEGGGWLLPDDGRDPTRSQRNSRAVQSRCLGQLLALGG